MRNNILSWAVLLTFCFAGLFSCKSKDGAPQKKQSESSSEITKAEADSADGWVTIFNGKNLEGWHVYNKANSKGKWSVDDGALFYSGDSDKEKGDIVTDQEYENFELMLDWKISDCGNSGIIWCVKEDPGIDGTWRSGPEMQVLDNKCHPDAKIITHRAGDLYDMISVAEETVKPAGEWNSAKIVSNNGKLQFHLNGTNVVNFEMFNDEWAAMIKDSKFSEMPHFGKYRKGRIALQDHGDDVWYRNIKIKKL